MTKQYTCTNCGALTKDIPYIQFDGRTFCEGCNLIVELEAEVIRD